MALWLREGYCGVFQTTSTSGGGEAELKPHQTAPGIRWPMSLFSGRCRGATRELWSTTTDFWSQHLCRMVLQSDEGANQCCGE